MDSTYWSSLSPSKKRGAKLLIFFGVAMFSAAIAFYIFPQVYRSQVNKMTNLVENSFLYPIWRDLPLPIYKRLYFFNITNAEDFVYNGAAMQVEEVGPYVYIGNWTKEDITWSDEGTVNYREVKTFHFSLEESAGSEEDKIYTLNAPYIAASNVLKDFGSTIRMTANSLLRSYKLVIYRSIKELAFEGYDDPLMDVSKYYKWNSPFSSGSFAWLYGHNATDEGDFDVFTGETDHSRMNMIYKWNGFKDLNFWKDKYCNMLNGTNAEFHPPIDQLKDGWYEYTFFQPLVCRSITYHWSDVVYYKGVRTLKFENYGDIFNKYNPNNYCFQTDPELKSGVLDVSNCWYGAPVVLSFPHFYLADSSFLENIDGLSPNKNDHGSHIAAEPVTGVTVDLSIKFQMNLNIKPVEELKSFENVTAGVYPVFWLDIKVQLTDDLIDTIKVKLFRPWNIAVITFGFLIAIFAFCFFYLACYKHRDLTTITYSTENYYKRLDEKKPLLKKDSMNNLLTDSFNSNTSSLATILNSHEDVKRENSFKTCRSASSSETLYQSYNDEDQEKEVSTHVDVHHSKKKELKERRSFKDARTLTVI